MAEQIELVRPTVPHREQPFIDLPLAMVEEDAMKLGPIGIAVYAVFIFFNIKNKGKPTSAELCAMLGVTSVAVESALRRLRSLHYLDEENNAAT